MAPKLGRTAELRHAVAMDRCRVQPAQGASPRLFGAMCRLLGTTRAPTCTLGTIAPYSTNRPRTEQTRMALSQALRLFSLKQTCTAPSRVLRLFSLQRSATA